MIFRASDSFVAEIFGLQLTSEGLESLITSEIQSMYFQTLPNTAGLFLIPHPSDRLDKNNSTLLAYWTFSAFFRSWIPQQCTF